MAEVRKSSWFSLKVKNIHYMYIYFFIFKYIICIFSLFKWTKITQNKKNNNTVVRQTEFYTVKSNILPLYYVQY